MKMNWIQLAILAAVLGTGLGSPAKAYADKPGKFVEISRSFSCDCGTYDTACSCI